MVDQSEPNYSSEETNKKLSFTTILIILVSIYIGYLLYQSVFLNYTTNEKIKNLKSELVSLEKDKKRLDILTAYYKTPSFQELEARKKLGLKMPGEKIIKVNVEEDLKPITQTENIEGKKDTKTNPQKWILFLQGIEK